METGEPFFEEGRTRYLRPLQTERKSLIGQGPVLGYIVPTTLRVMIGQKTNTVKGLGVLA
jgi:hypothetical protein